MVKFVGKALTHSIKLVCYFFFLHRTFTVVYVLLCGTNNKENYRVRAGGSLRQGHLHKRANHLVAGNTAMLVKFFPLVSVRCRTTNNTAN